MSEPENNQRMSRREFLRLLVTAAGAAVLGLEASACSTGVEKETPENSLIRLGTEEIIDLSPYGIQWAPDGHIPFTTTTRGKTGFISGAAASYAMNGSNPTTFVPRDVDSAGKALQVWGPDKTVDYRNGYSAITSLISPDSQNPDVLLGITHSENRTIRNGQIDWSKFRSSIGLIRSQDGGKNWNDLGPILQAADAMAPDKLPQGTDVTGVGQPCAIVKEIDGSPFAYIYYIYWSSDRSEPYQIYLSRAPIQNNGLGKIEHFTHQGFQANTTIEPHKLKPVLSAPAGIADAGYAALPAISSNTTLGKDTAIFETQVGFCLSTAEDGINWSPAELIFKFPQGQYPHQKGNTWYSNPSIWSPEQPNDQITSKTGYLLYSKGVWDSPHGLAVRQFEFK